MALQGQRCEDGAPCPARKPEAFQCGSARQNALPDISSLPGAFRVTALVSTGLCQDHASGAREVGAGRGGAGQSKMGWVGRGGLGRVERGGVRQSGVRWGGALRGRALFTSNFFSALVT